MSAPEDDDWRVESPERRHWHLLAAVGGSIGAFLSLFLSPMMRACEPVMARAEYDCTDYKNCIAMCEQGNSVSTNACHKAAVPMVEGLLWRDPGKIRAESTAEDWMDMKKVAYAGCAIVDD